MFNLVVIQDNETRSIRIEPYTWYYNDEDREVKDFTNILDTDLVYKKEEMVFSIFSIKNTAIKLKIAKTTITNLAFTKSSRTIMFFGWSKYIILIILKE